MGDLHSDHPELGLLLPLVAAVSRHHTRSGSTERQRTRTVKRLGHGEQELPAAMALRGLLLQGHSCL